MKTLSLRSPAKLNLFLKVLHKRKDGYHSLETLFERIDLCDHIQLTGNQEGVIRIFCDHPDVPLDSRNLVYRAVKLVQEEFGLTDGIDIQITKRIPVAAGLGGGSSNAATTLWGVNRLWSLHMTRKKLLALARKIGSDVSFFIHNCSWAEGRGRGDQIKRFIIPARLWHIVVVPALKVYSQEIFAAWHNEELTKPGDDVKIFIRFLRKNNLSAMERLLRNDLERAIVRRHPQLLSLKQNIAHLVQKPVIFSGSGPALFALAPTRREAHGLKEALAKNGYQTFIVRTL